jgi:lactoylglutathione lyase
VVGIHSAEEDPRESVGESTMRFGYTILYVRDIEGAVSFYEEAFGLKRRFVHESGQYAEMKTWQTTLAFASAELEVSNLQAGFRRNDPAGLAAGIEITFVSRNVDAAFEPTASG